MAVAVKTTPETTPRNPTHQLLVSSLLGAVFVLVSLGMVFSGLPILWNEYLQVPQLVNEFLSGALLMITTLVMIVGLVFLARLLEGPHPPHGLRAGIFFASVLMLAAGLIGLGFANLLAKQELPAAVVYALSAALAGGLLIVPAWLALRPGFAGWLVRVEEQGWFHATSFKANQGVRVRRGTVVALLVLIACGIYVIITHRTFGTGNWDIPLPYTDNYYLVLMFHVNYVLPVVLLVALAWAAWRVVNWPTFADFLIATEAEMNKVSWTTRKRLIQDTIVVLVTVVLFTVFLFLIDVLWIKVLSWSPIRVLQIDPFEERAKQNAPTEW